MKIGVVIEDTWDFFHEVYEHFSATYQVTLFERRELSLPLFNTRANRYLLRSNFDKFMTSNDVLFFEWGSDLLVLATHLPKRTGIVVRLHRYDLYAWFDKVNWDNVDKIIVVSQAKSAEFASKYPAFAHKLVVVPEAIDLTKFPYVSKSFQGNLGTLCHLKPRKRVYDLILAFYELSQKSNGLHLFIGGDPRPAYLDYYEAMQSLVRRLGLQQKVTFDGMIKDSAEWYKKIDIFISNSYSEGLQVSPMEAIAAGCFCLSHYWDGADELLPQDNLFYTSNELQEKILQFLAKSESQQKQLILALRDMVSDQFNVDRTKVQIGRLLEDIATIYNPHLKKLT